MRLAASATLLVAVCALRAQDLDRLDTHLKDYLNAADKDAAEIILLVDIPRQELARAATALLPAAEVKAARSLEFDEITRALDRHLSGDASGSTALAALSGVTRLISAAMENGGMVNRATNGGVTTFRVNTSAFARFFSAQQPCFLRNIQCNPTIEQHLKALSMAVAVDPSQPQPAGTGAAAKLAATNTPLPGEIRLPGLARTSQLRSVTAKWELRQRKDLSHHKQAAKWKETMQNAAGEAGELALAVNTYTEQTLSTGNLAFQTWKKTARDKLDAIAAQNIAESDKLVRMAASYRESLNTFLSEAGEPLAASALRVLERTTAFRRKRNELLHDALYPAAASIEYLYQRPPGQPEYSTVRLIIGKPFGEQPGADTGSGNASAAPLSQFTANLAASFYHAKPAAVGTVRDVQAAVQLDRVLPVESGAQQKPVFSLAGYFQYLAQPGVLRFDGRELTPLAGIPLPRAADVLLDTKGSIFIAQAKLTIPLGASGVNFPVAVSWANRTEFIKANYTKLQFGFTFDLDKLVRKERADR